MTDHHIHIGQFNEIYYDAFEIFEAVEKAGAEFGVNEIHYSSTSSCREDVELVKIEEEISYAQNYDSSSLVVKPYLWFTTNYSDKNINVKSAAQSFDYCGIKLHPFAHKWDFTNKKHRKTLEQIFEWSSEFQKPILIHSGCSEYCLPSRFEQFFKAFPDSNVIIAHSNPVDVTIDMLRKYSNLKCDIAFTKIENVKRLIEIFSTVKDRILFGSDFPITNYFSDILFDIKNSFYEQYTKDCKISKFLI